MEITQDLSPETTEEKDRQKGIQTLAAQRCVNSGRVEMCAGAPANTILQINVRGYVST
jgi:hypothetical protein